MKLADAVCDRWHADHSAYSQQRGSARRPLKESRLSRSTVVKLRGARTFVEEAGLEQQRETVQGFEIRTERDSGGTTRIVASGELDIAAVPQLEHEFDAVPGTRLPLVVDLGAITFTDSPDCVACF